VTQPGVTQPGVTQPGVTQPGVTQPGVTQPGVTQPGVTQPGVTQLGVTHHLVVGPGEHGVTRYALQHAAAGAGAGDTVTRVERAIGPGDVGPLLSRLPASGTHVHVTDKLFGASPEQAREVLTGLAAAGLSVTLHDLPQESDGPASRARRTACYAAVARAARRVVVSSEHERLLLQECLHPGGPLPGGTAVIPLAVDAAPWRPPAAHAEPPDVGLLGFVYPGKGHAEALRALAGLPEQVGLLALGRASAGHDDLLAELAVTAAALGRRLVVTGYLPDDQLASRLRTVAVPLTAHRHLSASASIGSWLTAGRRPLVQRSRYAAELADRLPGALTLYDDLPTALRAALADPGSTWLDPHTVLGPSTTEVARRYREVLG